MGCRHDSWLDDTAIEFPRFWFWVMRIISLVIFFVLGMRFALRKAPFAFIVYRLLSMFRHR